MRTGVEVKRLVSNFNKLSEISSDEKKLEEAYLLFVEDSIDTCKEIGELLSTRLPDETSDLEKSVKEVETWSFYLLSLVSLSEFYVDIYSRFYITPKSKTSTDLDRKVMMDFQLAGVKALNNLLHDTLKAISQRINLTQSCLKHQAALASFGSLGG